MSWELNESTDGAHAGLNVCAFGGPYENYNLNKVLPSRAPAVSS